MSFKIVEQSGSKKKEANAFVWRVLFALSAKTRLNKSQSLLYIPTFGGVAFQCWLLECDMGDNSYQAWTKGSHLRAVKGKKEASRISMISFSDKKGKCAKR